MCTSLECTYYHFVIILLVCKGSLYEGCKNKVIVNIGLNDSPPVVGSLSDIAGSFWLKEEVYTRFKAAMDG